MKQTGSLTNRLSDRRITYRHGENAVAYVESEDDIPFWKYIFKHFGISVKVIPGSRTKKHIQRGKTTILKQKNTANKKLLLCVDSDYDYLLQNDADQIHSNPYIFQTYTYSFENYLCNPNDMEMFCIDAILHDDIQFNFTNFFEHFSKITYDLFILHLFYHAKREENKFTLSHFNEIIAFPQHPKTQQDGANILHKIEKKIEGKIKDLLDNQSINNEDIQHFKNKMKELGLNKQNVYWFIQGHQMFKNTESLLSQICKKHEKDKVSEFWKIIPHNASETEKKKQAEEAKMRINEYRNNIKSVKDIILLSKNLIACPLWQKIEADISHYKTI